MSSILIRVGGIALFVVSAVLLTSIGGAGIFAAPVTLPLMYLAVNARPTIGFKIAGVVIGGLTGAEFGWAVGYAVSGNRGAVGLVGLVVGGSLAVVAFLLVRTTARPSDSLSPDG